MPYIATAYELRGNYPNPWDPSSPAGVSVRPFPVSLELLLKRRAEQSTIERPVGLATRIKYIENADTAEKMRIY